MPQSTSRVSVRKSATTALRRRAGPSVRPGIATRQHGKETARRIVEAARQVLIDEGCTTFSMRHVASRAGLHLANVQYYFPARDHLVRALLEDTAERYRQAFERCLAQAPTDRVQRFSAILRFILEDAAEPVTRRYFVQLWALLDSLDRRSGALLSELYRLDVAQLCELIAELQPKAAPEEVRQRATVLAAMIEGFQIVRGAYSADARQLSQLARRVHATGLEIALGRIGLASTAAEKRRG
jgi:AcrR family transcriptional regulator